MTPLKETNIKPEVSLWWGSRSRKNKGKRHYWWRHYCQSGQYSVGTAGWCAHRTDYVTHRSMIHLFCKICKKKNKYRDLLNDVLVAMSMTTVLPLRLKTCAHMRPCTTYTTVPYTVPDHMEIRTSTYVYVLNRNGGTVH